MLYSSYFLLAQRKTEISLLMTLYLNGRSPRGTPEASFVLHRKVEDASQGWKGDDD